MAKIKGKPIKTTITRKKTVKGAVRGALKTTPEVFIKTTKTKTGVRAKKGPVKVDISLGGTKAAKAIKKRRKLQSEYDKALGYTK